jgi:hypothetical protein
MITFPFTIFSGAGFINEYSTSFNGIDENINCSPEVTPEVNNLSVFAWVKLPSNATTRCVIANFHSGIGQRAWSLSVVASGNLRLRMSANGTSNAKSIDTNGQNVENNGWHLVGFTYNSVDQAKIWVDGVESAYTGTDGNVSEIHSSSANLYIGALSNGVEDFLGNIDEVTMWGGATLSEAEIINLYNGGVPIDPTTLTTSATLDHYWRMGDGDNATTVLDSAGSNNGTLINMDESNYVTDVPS